MPAITSRACRIVRRDPSARRARYTRAGFRSALWYTHAFSACGTSKAANSTLQTKMVRAVPGSPTRIALTEFFPECVVFQRVLQPPRRTEVRFQLRNRQPGLALCDALRGGHLAIHIHVEASPLLLFRGR